MMAEVDEESRWMTLLEEMQGNVQDVCLQKSCLGKITELAQARNRQNHRLVSNVETFSQIAEACVRACSAHPQDAEIQARVVHLLMCFCQIENRDEQEAMVKKGVAEAMLSAMRNHPRVPAVVLGSTHVLRCCCVRRSGESDLKRIREALPAWVNAMKAHPNNEMIVLHGARSINDIASGLGLLQGQMKAYLQACVRANAVGVVVQSLRAHPDQIMLQESCFSILARIATYSDDQAGLEQLWAEQAISVVLLRLGTLLEKKKTQPELQTTAMHNYACYLVSGLFEHRTQSCPEPSLAILPQSLEAHMHCTESVKAALAAILHSILHSKENAITVGERGCSLVLQAMKKFKEKADIQDFGMCVLATMLTHEIKMKACMVQKGCVEWALQMLDTHKEHANLHINALKLLGKTADVFDGSAVQQRSLTVLSETGVPILLESMTRHLQNEQVQLRANICLQYVALLPGFADRMQAENGIKVFVRSMETHLRNSQLLANILHTFPVIVKNHEKNKNTCREEGAIDVIVRATKTCEENSMVIASARFALDAITADHEANTAYLQQKLSAKRAMKLQEAFKALDLFQSVDVMIPNFSSREEQMKGFAKTMQNVATSEFRNTLGQYKPDMNSKVMQGIAEEREKQRLTEKCANCGKTAADCGTSLLLRCSGCVLAPPYCSVKCQKACWQAHKEECKSNRKQKA
jgi:hypothetical protein